jgi:hypothetical protein
MHQESKPLTSDTGAQSVKGASGKDDLIALQDRIPLFELKKFEYEMAQDMLKHYDTLNWQIGSILIAGVLLLTGLAINKEVIELMRRSLSVGIPIAFGIPILSFVILRTWLAWFSRHRQLYNFRNEVIQSIEVQLGMFHYLKVAQAKIRGEEKSGHREEKLDHLEMARSRARYDPEDPKENWWPLFPGNERLSGHSGDKLARRLAYGIPITQLVMLTLMLSQGRAAQLFQLIRRIL